MYRLIYRYQNYRYTGITLSSAYTPLKSHFSGINIWCILSFAKNCTRENKDTTFDNEIAKFDARENFRLYGIYVAGWSSGYTLAYHTSDRFRFPAGSVRRKSVRVSEVILCRIRGYTKGTGGDRQIICVCMFPVTRHNKELVEAQPWTSRPITHPPAFTAHMHTQVKGGHIVFQLENEKGRAQGRALCAQWTKEGTFYRKQALKLVKNAQFCCHGTYKGSLLMH